MENNNINLQIPEEKIIPSDFKKPDYYTKGGKVVSEAGKKIGDFFLGFLGIIVVYFFSMLFLRPLFSLENFGLETLIFAIVFLATLTVVFFRIGRRFIALGIISASLIPILLFGSCILLLSGFSKGG